MTAPEPVPTADVGEQRAIAVVIPAHNAARTIDATLASLAGQSLPPAEVVVVDDGSTDDGYEVATRWADMLPLRLVQTHGPVGVAEARNRGVAATSSPLFTMLDADDVVLPDHLEALAALHSTRLDVVTADALRWIPGIATSLEPWSARCPLPPLHRQHEALLSSCWLVIASLLDRSLFDEVGGFRPGLRKAEDWDLWLRIAGRGARFLRPDHPTMLYRLRAGSATTDDRLMDDVIAVLEAARHEVTTRPQRRSSALGLRRAKAERQLYRAYGAAAAGRYWTARASALRSVTGNRRVAVRGAAMSLAPRAVARRRAATHYDPGVWLRR